MFSNLCTTYGLILDIVMESGKDLGEVVSSLKMFENQTGTVGLKALNRHKIWMQEATWTNSEFKAKRLDMMVYLELPPKFISDFVEEDGQSAMLRNYSDHYWKMHRPSTAR